MSWYIPPSHESEREGDVVVVRLAGDWLRDAPAEVRRRAREALERDLGRAAVIDLTDVKLIDSWGEEAVCDAMQKVVDDGGRVTWVFEASRRAVYAGVVAAVDRRQLTVEAFASRAEAVDAVRRGG